MHAARGPRYEVEVGRYFGGNELGWARMGDSTDLRC